MTAAKRTMLISKAVQVAVLAVAVCFSLGATDAGSRFQNLGHRLMCTCGCAQLLGECNHVGCQASGKENAELKTLIAENLSDDQILSTFAAKYGKTVRAAPSTHGFDLVAWIAPFGFIAAATLGTILLIRRWRAGAPQLATVEATDPAADALREKIRRETDAGNDGGF